MHDTENTEYFNIKFNIKSQQKASAMLDILSLISYLRGADIAKDFSTGKELDVAIRAGSKP